MSPFTALVYPSVLRFASHVSVSNFDFLNLSTLSSSHYPSLAASLFLVSFLRSSLPLSRFLKYPLSFRSNGLLSAKPILFEAEGHVHVTIKWILWIEFFYETRSAKNFPAGFPPKSVPSFFSSEVD